jgi:hypothetical protein
MQTMWRFALLWIATPLLAQQQSVDLVLVLDATPGMGPSLSAAVFRPQPDDRVAVLAFTSKSRLAQNFTNDPQKLKTAIEALGHRRIPFGFSVVQSPEPATRLFRALLDAAQLFRPAPLVPGRQRIIVAFFGTEDETSSPAPDEVKLALAAAQITAFGIAVPRVDDHPAPDPRLETPPTLPGQTHPGTGSLAPLPEATMTKLATLATVMRADAGSGNGNILDVLKRVRAIQSQTR